MRDLYHIKERQILGIYFTRHAFFQMLDYKYELK